MTAARSLSVADFDYAGGFYYPDLVERLIAHLRENVPEITNESPGEPAIQLLRAFALVGHLNACLLDLVAHEALMVTSQLRDSLVAHLKLIGFEVAGDVPSTAELVLTLSKTFTATTEVVPALALFGTSPRGGATLVVFEADEAVQVTRTDRVTACFVYDASADTFTDRTTEANTDSSTFQTLPATPAAGDALYVGHDSAMTNRLEVGSLSVALANVEGVWEYCDEDVEEAFPDSVTVVGGATLKLVIDGLLGTDGAIDYSGLEVVVTLAASGATETLTSAHDGTNNYVTTTGFLGQSSPSTAVRDYSIGSQWHPLPDLDDDTNNGTSSLEVSGDVDFSLPKSADDDWQPIEVNEVTAFWLRYRVISVSGTPTPATVDRLKWNRRDTFVQVAVTQGQTRTETLGSSDGTASQSFALSVGDVIESSVSVEVDGVEWSEVDNFLSSTAIDQHYTLELDSDGVATVTFGDGVTGAIPASGTNNVAATYRTGANEDGNVGADTIIVNRSGVGGVKRITNPRPATGWVERRGATAADRERLKLEGPASLRTLGRAVSAPDVETLSTLFEASDGSTPFVRCRAIEEGYGTKTVRAVVVGPAGAATLASKRRELEAYFNGDADTGESGIMVANQQVIVTDYTPRTIDVAATITGGSEETIRSALAGFLSPVATRHLDENDDTSPTVYRWSFGATVTRSKISATIFRADSDVEDVSLTAPAADVILDDDELPEAGTLTLTFA